MRSWVVLLALVVAAAASTGWAPSAHASGTVKVLATIDGQPLAGSNAGHPLRLYPGKESAVDLEVTNSGNGPVTIRTVDLTGRVIGLAFYSFQTAVSLTVEPGSHGSLQYLLDLSGLRGQATGLIPASLNLHDAAGTTISSQGFVSDVRGSLVSVYGLFGLVVLVLTLLALAAVLLALARHRLPTNRWMRGLRFLTPGLGIGLVLVFTLSALRIFVPRAETWVLLLAISAVALFVIGYLTPSPVEEGDDEDDEDDLDDDVEESSVPLAGTGARETRRVPPSVTEGWPGPPA